MKLLDGNCIEKSQHRIEELRLIASGPLSGKSLVVYDPVLDMHYMFSSCEDGHAQERSLLKVVLSTIETADVWVSDRNFCTIEFTCRIALLAPFLLSENIKSIHGNRLVMKNISAESKPAPSMSSPYWCVTILAGNLSIDNFVSA